MVALMVGVLSFAIAGDGLPLPRSGLVSAARVYVTASTEDPTFAEEVSRCVESLRRALTPSLGTLVPAERRRDADIVVEISKCELDAAENVFRIESRLTIGGTTEIYRVRRTLTRSRPEEWQMQATAKGFAKDLLHKVEADRPH